MTYNYLNCICFFFLILTEPGHAYTGFEIVGGDPVTIEEVPFFAIYKEKDKMEGCGATIVSDRFLISAEHCYASMKGRPTVAVVGTDKIGEGEIYDIAESYPYNTVSSDMDGDIVLLKLAKALVFSSKVQPIQLAEPNMDIADGSIFRVMGFGYTAPTENAKTDVLLQVNVPYVKNEDCQKYYRVPITPRMICAGDLNKGSCNGDSGGPLIFQNKHIGIVSFGGPDCSTHGSPTVFAKISALRDFIDKYVAK